jgi:hypothetical protein
VARRNGLLALLTSLILLASCDRLPDSYAPPFQRHPVEGYNFGPQAMMVEMSDADANLHIVKDIYSPGDPSWRWTAQEPTIKTLVLSTQNLKFHADFSIWNDSFKVTGPLEIAFQVDGRVLDKIRYDTPGEKHFDEPVPADWLTPNIEASLAMSVDKIYVAPNDGKKFGVILLRMGLK